MCLFLFNPSKCQRENYYKSSLSAAKSLETVPTKTVHVKYRHGPHTASGSQVLHNL